VASTYKAVELAALVLEGNSFDEAVEESSKAWTGSLEEDHRRALELLQKQRDALRKVMSDRLTPDQVAEYRDEVSQNQFLELTRPNATKRNTPEESGG
jgi:threonine dehydrogenase-like Zn-dependent dehydrogenase